MEDITTHFHSDGSYTVIGNPHDETYWDIIKSCELVKMNFHNDGNQIDEFVKEMREKIEEEWNSNRLTLTLIGIDEPLDTITGMARKYRARGHAVGVWNWTHSYYVISFVHNDLRIPSIRAGKDGFGRFGNHVVADV